MNSQSLRETMRHVWLEPRSLAEFEWLETHNPFAWVSEISPREWALYFEGENPELGERTISIPASVFDLEPDWDWWEPRHDQPWRRKAMRSTKFKETGKADV